MTEANYYQTLNISPLATHDEIVQAYRRLARDYHPDLQPSEMRHEANEIMKRLNAAYEVLGNPLARAFYDARLRLQQRSPTTPVSVPFQQPRSTSGHAFLWQFSLLALSLAGLLMLVQVRQIPPVSQLWNCFTAGWIFVCLPLTLQAFRSQQLVQIKRTTLLLVIPFTVIALLFLAYTLGVNSVQF